MQDGHQVMVFVHARKETVKSAQKLLEMAKDEGMVSFFETREHPKFDFYRRDVATSRNKEMKELFDAGFGIHHAGMLRSDRNMMERMFEDNAIKVRLARRLQLNLGTLLYIDSCMGCELASTCCCYQRNSGL